MKYLNLSHSTLHVIQKPNLYIVRTINIIMYVLHTPHTTVCKKGNFVRRKTCICCADSTYVYIYTTTWMVCIRKWVLDDEIYIYVCIDGSFYAKYISIDIGARLISGGQLT